MSPERALARMAASRNWTGECGGGVAELTLAEVSGFLSRLPKRLELAARYIGCLDDSVTTDLRAWLVVEISKTAAVENWKIPRGSYIMHRMATAAMLEIQSPLNFRGMVEKQHPPQGQGAYSDSGIRRRACDISETSWRDTWSKRYEIGYNALSDWYATAKSHIRRMSK